MNGASAQRVLQAHRSCDSHRRAWGVRWEQIRLVFHALLVPCSSRDQHELEIGRLVVLEMLDSPLVLLALERRDLVETIFDGLEDLGLLFFGGEFLVREETLGAGDVRQRPVLVLRHLLLCRLHDFRLVDDL